MEANEVIIWIKPERSWWDIAFPLLIPILLITTIQIGWAGIIVCVMIGFFAWSWFLATFGTQQMVISPTTLKISTHALGLSWTKKFECSDIDWIAYRPHAYRSTSCIGLLVRDRLMPLEFASEVSEEDAAKILESLKLDCTSLTGKVKLPTEHSFYKLAS